MDVNFIKEMATSINDVVVATGKPYLRQIDILTTQRDVLLGACRALVVCVDDELIAAGADEVKEHPILAYHNKVVKVAKEAIKEAERPVV